MDAMASAAKVERAHELAIAALLSDAIYNFGDLVRAATAHTHTHTVTMRTCV